MFAMLATGMRCVESHSLTVQLSADISHPLHCAAILTCPVAALCELLFAPMPTGWGFSVEFISA